MSNNTQLALAATLAEMAERAEKRDELLLAAIKEIATGVNVLAGALASQIPFDPLAKPQGAPAAAPAAASKATERDASASEQTAPAAQPPVTSVADAPVAKAPEAVAVAPAATATHIPPKAAPAAVPAAAPAAAPKAAERDYEQCPKCEQIRRASPDKDDIQRLTAAVRAYLSASPDNVATLRDAIVNHRVVRVSDVRTWAEYEALANLIEKKEEGAF